MSVGAHYAWQSRWTDPGPHGFLLDDLPTGPDDLRAVVRGLVTHYMAPVGDGGHVPADRLSEVDAGDVRAMLGRIVDLAPRPLAESRPIDRRLVGCCRDFALLLCAFLRHRGVA
ncbi:MAG: hypothetical protein M3462_15545 [Chloroflexota bacterium]|nr:hypothetical protein [Chloroflexota bacterium]